MTFEIAFAITMTILIFMAEFAIWINRKRVDEKIEKRLKGEKNENNIHYTNWFLCVAGLCFAL